MKKVMILFLILFCFSFISASFECSVGIFDEDSRELDIGEARLINGIGVGLIDADETAVLSRVYVKIIFDSAVFEINDLNNHTFDFDLKFDSGTIHLESLTGSSLEIKVDDDSEEMNVGDITTINNFEVYILSAEGVYPNASANVSGMIGYQVLELDNNDSGEIVVLDGKEYLVELFTASDSDAVLEVKFCENENATINEIADPVEIPESEINESVEDNSTNETLPEEIDNTPLGSNNQEIEIVNAQEEGIVGKVVFFLIVAGIVAIIILLVVFLFKKKSSVDNFNPDRFKEEKAIREEK